MRALRAMTWHARARAMLGKSPLPEPLIRVYTPPSEGADPEDYETLVARCDDCSWVETRTFHKETLASTDLGERWTEGALLAHAREAHKAVL